MAAGNAKIGALHVSLGLDSAQFLAGLKSANRGLNKFGVQLTLGLETIAEGIGRVIGAFPRAIKSAIDHADALSKSAQKAGITTEALSRLAYAADFSDVSMESLTGGLQKLSKAMADAATNKTSSAALAFKALGVSVTDASGRLRGSDAVFSDLSDRFARMEDGATKTALAMQIFGKSGADMIPLLNGGSAELKRMADEADRLGITLSTKAGKDAERFNDTLTLIGKILQGVVNKVMTAALPALQSLANLLASPAFANAAAGFGVAAIEQLSKIIEWIGRAQGKWEAFVDFMNRSGRQKVFPLQSTNIEDRTDPDWLKKRRAAGAVVSGSFDALGGSTTFDSTADLWRSMTPFAPIITGADNAKKSMIDLTENVGKFTDSSREMAAAVGDGLGNAFARLADAVMSGNDALSATVDILMDLGKQLVSSAITGFFGKLLTGGLMAGAGLGSGAIGRGTYGGSGGFFPGLPGFASGTNFAPGGPAWVGENGPELVNLPRGSQVIPNHELGGGRSEMLVRLSPGLEAQILQKAAGQSVQIASEVVQQQSPAVNAKARRNKVI